MSLLLLHRAATATGYRTPAHKLVLMCLADSAGDGDHIALPGHEAMCAWAIIGRSQLYAILADLRADGLVDAVSRAAPGLRARYRVFPADAPDESDNGSGTPESARTGPVRVRNGSGTGPAPTLNPSNVRSTKSEGSPVVQTSPADRARAEQPCTIHLSPQPCRRCALDRQIEQAPPRPTPKPTADVARGAAAARAALRSKRQET